MTSEPTLDSSSEAADPKSALQLLQLQTLVLVSMWLKQLHTSLFNHELGFSLDESGPSSCSLYLGTCFNCC